MLQSTQHARTMSIPLLCPVSEAARLLAVGRTKTYEMLASGELESIRIGTRRLVKMDSIQAFIDRATGGVE
jgi:excisionase family DNA binding protein